MYRLGLFTIILLVSHTAQTSNFIHYRPKFHSALEDDTISIQTLNAYHTSYAGQNVRRGSSIVKMLEQDSSDINFFQEVWLKHFYTNMKKTSQNVGLKSIVYDDVAKNTKRSGLVTIIKGNIHKKEMHFFPLGKDWYDTYVYRSLDINKGFGIVYITHPKFPNTPFWAVNTHLHHLNQETRLLQLVHYLKWFLNKVVWQDPIIFAGDFNFEPDSLEFEMIQHMFRFKEPQSYLGLSYSCTAFCRDNEHSWGHTLNKLSINYVDYEKTVDYIFFKSSTKVKLIPKRFRVFPKKYDGKFLSDHYGLRADISFKDGQGLQKPNNEKELKKKIQNFSQTLDKVQSLLSKDFVSEHQFLNSLRAQLDKPESVLLQHLRQN